MQLHIKISIKHLPKQLRDMASAAGPAMKRGLLSGAMRCIPLLQNRVRNAPPANPSGLGTGGAVDTGAYLQAMTARATPSGAIITNKRKYAAVIDDGRRVGARPPPRRVLEKWVMRRLGLSAKEAKSAAFLIGRAISKRGLLPRKVMRGATDDIMKIMNEEVKLELMKSLKAAAMNGGQ